VNILKVRFFPKSLLKTRIFNKDNDDYLTCDVKSNKIYCRMTVANSQERDVTIINKIDSGDKS